MDRKTITIAPRFCGPDHSGNGGYVCGMMANHVGYVPEVTLRKPPPLASEMELVTEADRVLLTHKGDIVASMELGHVAFQAPSPPDLETAIRATGNYLGFKKHPFPHCFVCGPERHKHDALCIYPGKVGNDGMVAAPWTPHGSLLDTHGNVRNEFIWAALDCPGAFAIMDSSRPMVLGRMAARIEEDIEMGAECVVIGWAKRSEGRKHFSGTAIFSKSKGLCAVAHATWIDVV